MKRKAGQFLLVARPILLSALEPYLQATRGEAARFTCHCASNYMPILESFDPRCSLCSLANRLRQAARIYRQTGGSDESVRRYMAIEFGGQLDDRVWQKLLEISPWTMTLERKAIARAIVDGKLWARTIWFSGENLETTHEWARELRRLTRAYLSGSKEAHDKLSGLVGEELASALANWARGG